MLDGLFIKREVAQVKAVDDVSFTIRKLKRSAWLASRVVARRLLAVASCSLRKAPWSIMLMVPTDKLGSEELIPFQRIQVIFQDPYSSLNPRMTIGAIISEPMKVHNILPSEEARKQRARLLHRCGLNPKFYDRYPHEMYGGQRQRVGIARALAMNRSSSSVMRPSALDVSIQAQVINLLEDLREEFSLTYLFIAHDLSVVRHISHRVAVMYLGKMVEFADGVELFDYPTHPYTRAAERRTGADPAIEAERERQIIKGEIPSPINPPSGCVPSALHAGRG